MKLLVATGNKGKIKEIIHEVEVAGLQERGLVIVGLDTLPPGFLDVVEDQPTFLGNASKKARHFATLSGLLTLADDSGLCVEALGGEPGVRSARYAGEPCDNAANNAKLLREMENVPEGKRQAKFVCAMSLASPPPMRTTTGNGGASILRGEAPDLAATDLAAMLDEVQGEILRTLRGEHGFGYDPLFYHPASRQTTAELAMAEKSKLSHRGKALRRMIAWMVDHWEQLSTLGNG